MELQNNSAEHVVSFQNVWKRYGEVIAASNLNLDVKSGEFLSFLGAEFHTEPRRHGAGFCAVPKNCFGAKVAGCIYQIAN